MTAPQAAARAAPSSKLARGLRELVVLLACAALISFLLKTLVAQAFYIPSRSMVPQLDVHDRVVVSKVSYRLHPPRRGDIVVFDCPRVACPDDGVERRGGVGGVLRAVAEGVGLVQPSTEEFIKRVVGLPGETVEGRDGRVYVDGRRLVEPYLPSTARTPAFPPIRVPSGHLFVMGDNRTNSSDSRIFGPVARSVVVGRTVFRIWPPGRASFL